MRIVQRNHGRKAAEMNEIPHLMVKTADEGPHRPAYILMCESCGAKEQKIFKAGVVPPLVVRNAFTAAGWSVAKHDNRDHDKCPSCVAKKKPVIGRDIKPVSPPPADRQTLHLYPKPAEVPAMTNPAPTTKSLDRATKRKVLDLIEANYHDETMGYHPGWNDARVAKELDVPVALIASLRDEFFGPAVAERTKAEVIKDMRALYDMGRKLHTEQLDILSKRDGIKKLLDDLDRQLEAVRDQIADMNQDYSRLHDLVMQLVPEANAA